MKKTAFIATGSAFVTLAAIFTVLNFWKEPPETSMQLPESSYCSRESFEGKSYIICRANPKYDDIRLFLHNEQGKAYKRFAPLNTMLAQKGEKLAFAMNAGMYNADYNAVGLYIENGQEGHAISTKDGPGNFHMKPNGIFYLDKDKAAVLETSSYLERFPKNVGRSTENLSEDKTTPEQFIEPSEAKTSLIAPRTPSFATQSGPMLVIDNQIHPRFISNSAFLEYRNGVGVTQAGEVLFVISEKKVNFDEMARFFRDVLGTPNALFLDGSISSLYAPELGRADWFYPMGPIVGVVVKSNDMTKN